MASVSHKHNNNNNDDNNNRRLHHNAFEKRSPLRESRALHYQPAHKGTAAEAVAAFPISLPLKQIMQLLLTHASDEAAC